MTEPGILWENIPQPEKDRAIKTLRKSIMSRSKYFAMRWKALERKLKRILDAMEMEITHKGVASTVNIAEREKVLKEMIVFINVEVKK